MNTYINAIDCHLLSYVNIPMAMLWNDSMSYIKCKYVLTMSDHEW